MDTEQPKTEIGHLAASQAEAASVVQAVTGSAEVRAALDYDSLHEAEQITGRSYKEDESTSMLGLALHIRQREQKNRVLTANRDTNTWNQTLAEWIAVIEDMGFRLLSCEDIPGTGDKYRIWWHDDGILLHADSYRSDKTVNGANAIFNYRGPRDAMHSCSSGFAGELDGESVWDASRDAREGFRFAVDQMRAKGRFVKPWLRWNFRWLLHYIDTKDEDYDYHSITARRVASLPDDVRAVIGAAS